MEKRKITELVCILDQSGSMYGKEADTVESYNRMLGEQKEKEGEAFITTALFSDQCRILGSHIPLAQAAELTEREYFAEGNTALFDAIGQVFGEVSKKLQKEGEDAEERVLVFIITDGLENASTEYGPEKIRELIEEKQQRGWEILFFGTTCDILELARKSGVRRENTIRYEFSSLGLKSGYETAGRRFSRLREQ